MISWELTTTNHFASPGSGGHRVFLLIYLLDLEQIWVGR